MGAGLDSGRFSNIPAADMPPSWTPNYAEIASSISHHQYERAGAVTGAQQPPFADYLQAIESPNYAAYAFGQGNTAQFQTPALERSAGYSPQSYSGALSNPSSSYDTSVTPAFYPTPTQSPLTNGGQWRAQYGGDVGTTFVPGQQASNSQPGETTTATPTSNNGGQWRAQYGGDVGTTFRPGQSTTSQSGETTTATPTANNGGQWRAQYGGDVGTTFRPGQSTTPSQPAETTTPGTNNSNNNNNGGQWRAPYGGDTGTTFRPGGSTGNSGTGSGDNTGTAQQGDPNANGNATVQAPAWHPQAPTQSGVPGAGSSSTGGGAVDRNVENKIQAQVDTQLQPQTGSMYSHYLIGGAGGVIGGTLIPGVMNRYTDAVLGAPNGVARPATTLDRLASHLPESMRTKLQPQLAKFNDNMDGVVQRLAGGEGSTQRSIANYWRNNFDPREARQSKIQAINDAHADAKSTADLDLNAATTARSKYYDELVAKYGENASSSMTPEEAARVRELTNAQTAAQTKLTDVDSAISKETGAIKGVEDTGIFGNFLRGAGVAGASMAVNDYLDRFDGHNHQEGINSGILGINALSIPLAAGMVDNLGMGRSLALGVGSVVAGHYLGNVLDKVLPSGGSSQSFGQLFRPNGIDDITLGAAVALPATNWRTKAALLGTSWLAGRMANVDTPEALAIGAGGGLAAAALAPNWEMKATVLGLDAAGFLFSRIAHANQKNADAPSLNDQAWGLMHQDTSSRTASSMDAAISKFEQLGQNNEGALQYYFNYWMNPSQQFKDPLEAYRNAVILSASLGQSRLAHGTVTDQSNGNPSGYILGGQNLDLGGDALRSLLIAQINVQNAEKVTQQMVGKSDDGKQVTQSEVTDLQQVGQQITNTIQNKIYGKHDINAAMQGYEAYYKSNTQGAAQLLTRTQYALQTNMQGQNVDKQFCAKLARDSALMDMAVAQFKLNGPDAGGAAAAFYGDSTNNNGTAVPNGALGMLQLAEKLDPNNPDLPQLKQEAAAIQAKLPAAQQRQVSNPVYNPLNVGNALPATKR